MECLNCKTSKCHLKCGNCGVAYCGIECQTRDWSVHRKTCMLIQGKRARSPSPARQTEGMDELMVLLFSTLRRTPEMLENLANVMTFQQLRDLKFNKALNRTIWRNSLFWYYVIRRHRPDILNNAPFDPDVTYKRLAMRRVIAPDYTVRHPQQGEMNPRLQQVLQVMMRNPAAVEVILQNISWREIRNYMRVSVDFNRLVANSNILWFMLWREYGNYDNTSYNTAVNYRQKLSEERPSLFDTALIIDFHTDPLVVQFEGEARKYWNSMLNQIRVTVIDILKDGGLEHILDIIEREIDFNLLGENKSFDVNRGKVFVYYDLKGQGGDTEMWENAPSFEQIITGAFYDEPTLDELEAQLLNGEQDTLEVSYNMTLEMPEEVKLTLRYPQTIQPYRYNMSRREWVVEGSRPAIMLPPIIEKVETFNYYKEDDFLYDVDLGLPSYFALRGDTTPLDMEQWGYLKINGEYAHFEHLEEKVRDYISKGVDVLVEMIPKE